MYEGYLKKIDEKAKELDAYMKHEEYVPIPKGIMPRSITSLN